MRALDELLRSWRANPDAAATIAVSSYLGSSKRDDLIREVGASADTWHSGDANVMLAVGRMYLEAELLQEAQTSLVLAGKANATDPRAFRFLGEVLLRRGDALRAEKVLVRARELGGTGDDIELWHERAVLYSALQKRVGPEAVAAEVGRSMPRHVSVPPGPADDIAPLFAEEEVTRPHNEPPTAVVVSRKPTLVGLAESTALPRFDSTEAQHGRENGGLGGKASPVAATQQQLKGAAAAAFKAGESAQRVPTPPPFKAQRPAPPPALPTRRPSAPPPSAPPVPAGPPFAVAPPPPVRAPSSPPAVRAPSSPPAVRAPSSPPAARAPSSPPAARAPSSPPPRPAVAAAQAGDPVNPAPAVVLEHLARVGLYEPGGGATPAWETPPRQKSRSAVVLLVATVLIAGAGLGTLHFSRKAKLARAEEAETLNAQIDKLLKTGSPIDLKSTDERLTRSFELDSRNQRAGRLWLHNRVLNALLLAGETRGIDAAVHRGRQVGLAEQDLLVGKVASFLVEGDVAGGAALLTRGDKEAPRDAYYQLVAGAVLERAGDVRAVERYRAASQLAPDLVAADLLLARLLLLEAGSDAAKPVIESLLRKSGDTPVTRALSALSWVVSHDRAEDLPAPAQLQPSDVGKLPAPLAAVPAMVEAAKALSKQDLPATSRAIDSAIALAMSPALAAGLGFLAIEAGDEAVARKAALRALQFSGVYPRARTLAARVALLGGRIDEAQKAIEGLDPTSADVAVVRAVVAYESLETADLRSALEALGNSAVGPAFSALDAAPGVVNGSAFPAASKLEQMAAPDKPWGELIAVDAALETGNLELADKLLAKRTPETLRPVHLRRLARLRRFQGKLADALRASAAAAEGGMALPLLLERIYALLATDDVAGAKQLASKHPSLLGPLAGWVGVLTDVASRQVVSAAVRLTKLDVPPDESPILVRVLVARALKAGKDKRAGLYLTALTKKLPKNPDVLAASAL